MLVAESVAARVPVQAGHLAPPGRRPRPRRRRAPTRSCRRPAEQLHALADAGQPEALRGSRRCRSRARRPRSPRARARRARWPRRSPSRRRCGARRSRAPPAPPGRARARPARAGRPASPSTETSSAIPETPATRSAWRRIAVPRPCSRSPDGRSSVVSSRRLRGRGVHLSGAAPRDARARRRRAPAPRSRAGAARARSAPGRSRRAARARSRARSASCASMVRWSISATVALAGLGGQHGGGGQQALALGGDRAGVGERDRNVAREGAEQPAGAVVEGPRPDGRDRAGRLAGQLQSRHLDRRRAGLGAQLAASAAGVEWPAPALEAERARAVRVADAELRRRPRARRPTVSARVSWRARRATSGRSASRSASRARCARAPARFQLLDSSPPLLLVAAGVVDRDRGLGGERQRDLLVVARRTGPDHLVREVEVAEHRCRAGSPGTPRKLLDRRAAGPSPAAAASRAMPASRGGPASRSAAKTSSSGAGLRLHAAGRRGPP